MPGSNAFAFTGAAFVPANRNSTATIKARPQGTTLFSGVARAYYLTPKSQIWIGYPSSVQSLTVANTRTGTFPNLANSIGLSWSVTNPSIISGFNVYYDSGSGFTLLNPTPLSNSTTTYLHGNRPVGTHKYYVRSLGISGLNTDSSQVQIILAGGSSVGTLSQSSTTTTATASWTVSAGVFQRFHIYDNATYKGEVLATAGGTSYSFARTGLSQGTAYNFKVFGQNYDGFWGAASELNISTGTMPVPAISWESTTPTLYSGFKVSWTGSAGVTYQPEQSADNISWSNLGASQSGSGAKTSDAISPAYNDDTYIRVLCSDGEVSAYTNTRSVTPGTPEAGYNTTAAWSGDSVTYTSTSTQNSRNGSFTNGSSNGQSIVWWGDAEAINIYSSGYTDRKVTGVTIRASKISGFTGDLTSISRRLVISLNGTTSSYTGFDGTSATETYTTGHTLGYSGNDSGPVSRTASYGVRDAISYWSTSAAVWRYSSTTGQNNFWPSDRTSFLITVSYRERYWSPSVYVMTQSQVPSTYS